ncbi:MAG: type IV secretion protein IcmB [Gammaproteobacteria bacterium]
MSLMDPVVDSIDTILSWISTLLKQTTETYCDLETAEDRYTLVARDGSLVSIIRIHGVTALVGADEFQRLHEGLTLSMQSALSRAGHGFQVLFHYDKEGVAQQIDEIYEPARQTAKDLRLNLDDLFIERRENMSRYCAKEDVFLVLYTRPALLTTEQHKRASKDKVKIIKENKLPPLKHTQNLMAAFPDLRNSHHSFVRATVNDLENLNVTAALLDVHRALYEVRMTVDPGFTDVSWRPFLPGDKIPKRYQERFQDDISNLLYPPLHQQLMTRDVENVDLRTVRIGDRIYSSIFIELFPKDIKPFIALFRRTLPTQIPWRISFQVESKGLASASLKPTLAAILAFTSSQNKLLHDAYRALQDYELNTDDPVVKLRVAAATWAPMDDERLLRDRASQLAKAIEGWGNCGVTEISGDPFGGVVSSMLALSSSNEATASIAPLNDVMYMLPFIRPASPWIDGALLFRSPDGKPWPFQPGSRLQTTWIDLLYARPGSGKSVLSNAINLGLCLMGGLKRLPRIAIIDIGPSSSGLISLLKESLPPNQRHWVAYHRMRMTAEYSINPFDTQLGCRFPTAQERSFLVNFLTLLATPIGTAKPYDAVPDMAGMIVDELYKHFNDSGNPRIYSTGLEPLIDGILEEIGFIRDQHTTWWEVTDALFMAGFSHEAILSQRYAMPLLADAASMARTKSVADLYGDINAPTGETLVDAFSRMISGAIREYPVLSRITAFDLGEARVVSLDLDEVAKSGGDVAERQTAVMYMLARYILARDFYLTTDNVNDMPDKYQAHHKSRIDEIRDDPKRIVYDEFHRTSKAQAVRDQVIVDMREGRKWKVQVALLSQSIDDFDSVMVEFATATYILDAGPAQAVKKTAQIFGLSETAQVALTTRVHGPREGGSTFLVQYATKKGSNIQLLTSTLGPIELWAFSTTAEDAKLRNALYNQIGPGEARRLLAKLFPSGSAMGLVEKRITRLKEKATMIEEESGLSIVDGLIAEVIEAYRKDPDAPCLVE